MATSLLREITAADVHPDDLNALAEALDDISYLSGSSAPVVEFLTHLVESLRAGTDMVIMATDPSVTAVLGGLSR